MFRDALNPHLFEKIKKSQREILERFSESLRKNLNREVANLSPHTSHWRGSSTAEPPNTFGPNYFFLKFAFSENKFAADSLGRCVVALIWLEYTISYTIRSER